MTDKPRAPRKSRRSLTPTKTGRPEAFDQDLADTICTQLTEGKTLRQICSEKGMPDLAMIRRWIQEKPLFNLHYSRARTEQTRAWADQIISLSDDMSNDYRDVTTVTGKAVRQVDRPHIERVRLQIETRKWIMARVNKAEFGDKTSDSDGTPSMIDSGVKEMLGQLVHLLAQFEIHLTPDQVRAVQVAVTATDDEARLGH